MPRDEATQRPILLMAVLIGNIAATLITAIHIAVTNAVLLEDFYPYNPEVHKQIIRMDDGSSRPIVLNPPLHFYGRSYSACWVCFVSYDCILVAS